MDSQSLNLKINKTHDGCWCLIDKDSKVHAVSDSFVEIKLLQIELATEVAEYNKPVKKFVKIGSISELPEGARNVRRVGGQWYAVI